MATPNSLIGSSIRRVEDARFLQGRGEYVGDLTRAGMLHAVLLRSPIAHGRIRAIDTAAALCVPGVRAIITAREIGPDIPIIPLRAQTLAGADLFRQPVIAQNRIRYVGEPIAVVVGDSIDIAMDAAAAIDLDIEALPPVMDRAASGSDQTLLFENTDTNLVVTYSATLGDVDSAFRDAPYVRRQTFRTQRHLALPMEPRGLLAAWDSGSNRLTVMGAAKVAFANRRVLAAMLALSEDAIELVENDVGGGFGVRGEFYPEDFLIPFAARRLGRPVKWIETRLEHMMSINHAREADCEIEIGCRQDGTILGIRGAAFVDIGAYIRPNGLIQPRNLAQFLAGPYRIPNLRIDCSVLVTNKTPSGTYRAPGRFESSFFCERLFDIAARDLGLDPIAFRRRNLVSEAEIPHPFPRITPADGLRDVESDSGAYSLVLDRCVAEFGWADKARLDGRLIEGRYHGIGVGCFVEGGGAGPKENARLVLESDGDVSVYVGSSAIGQGIETAFAQIAADTLDLPMARIRRVNHGSTAHVREGFGSFASRSTIMGGCAILAAATKFKEALREAAARRCHCSAAEIHWSDGALHRGASGEALSLAELARDGISVEESFVFTKPTYAYGAAAAHVAVDPSTGCIEVLDYLLVEDVGRIVNPLMLHGQALGALVQGLGGTFFEHLVYDSEGQLLSGTLADYAAPIATDFSNLRVLSLQLRPSPHNPLGVKGAGEGGIIAVGGVIANAVASALRSLEIEPTELPLSPPKIWQLIETARLKKSQSRSPPS